MRLLSSGSKKGRERIRYRSRLTFGCDVRIYRPCVKLAENHTAVAPDLLVEVHVRLDEGVVHRDVPRSCYEFRGTVFYLIYELQAPRRVRRSKRGPGFIHMYAG